MLTQGLMELTRHWGHGGGRKAVDVERPHLVDLCGGEGHTRCEITSVGCCHDGCLLLHELKKMDNEMGGVGLEKMGESRRGTEGGGRRGERWTDGDEK